MQATPMTTTRQSVADRVSAADWPAIAQELDAVGCALTPAVLTAAACAEIASWYDDGERFRSTVDMERFRFGAGQYRYFDRPYPPVIQELREAFYPRLLPVAREWAARLGRPAPWPETLDEWLAMCHRVVGANGALTGYAGGVSRKRDLLTLEGAMQPTLV